MPLQERRLPVAVLARRTQRDAGLQVRRRVCTRVCVRYDRGSVAALRGSAFTLTWRTHHEASLQGRVFNARACAGDPGRRCLRPASRGSAFGVICAPVPSGVCACRFGACGRIAMRPYRCPNAPAVFGMLLTLMRFVCYLITGWMCAHVPRLRKVVADYERCRA